MPQIQAVENLLEALFLVAHRYNVHFSFSRSRYNIGKTNRVGELTSYDISSGSWTSMKRSIESDASASTSLTSAATAVLQIPCMPNRSTHELSDLSIHFTFEVSAGVTAVGSCGRIGEWHRDWRSHHCNHDTRGVLRFSCFEIRQWREIDCGTYTDPSCSIFCSGASLFSYSISLANSGTDESHHSMVNDSCCM